MLLAGLRRCEVLGLRFEDVQVAGRRLRVVDGKGGHHRLVSAGGPVLRRAGRLYGQGHLRVITNSTYSRLRKIVSTVNKSHASRPSAGTRSNLRP